MALRWSGGGALLMSEVTLREQASTNPCIAAVTTQSTDKTLIGIWVLRAPKNARLWVAQRRFIHLRCAGCTNTVLKRGVASRRRRLGLSRSCALSTNPPAISSDNSRRFRNGVPCRPVGELPLRVPCRPVGRY